MALRLERLLEQAVLAVFLCLALSAWIGVDGAPYASFLLGGLAPWFYFREILTDLPQQPSLLAAAWRRQGISPIYIPVNQAIAALPTLLIWTGIALAVHALQAGAYGNLILLPYMLLCSLYNAVAQGMMISAFIPLMPGGAINVGLSVTLPFLFWSTPLAWPYLSQGGIFELMMQLNPLYYLAEALRGALYGGMPSLQHTLLFFLMTTGAGVLGYLLTKRVWARAFEAA